jgi:hypothetical protein
MKNKKSIKSKSLSPTHLNLNQNNKSNNSIQKNKNNSESINTINTLNKIYSSEKVLQIITKNKYIIPSKKKLERRVYRQFNQTYSNDENFYNIKIINEIISNENTHIVSEFKDYLISGDYSEFLQKLYTLQESRECLPKIFEYYDYCSVIFPNYVILPENKYIYKNIQKKQRVIDNQQDLEEKQEKIQQGLIKVKDDITPVFTTLAIDSILDQTNTSGIKAFFGLKELNDSSKNISFNNIINKISKAENYIQKISDRKNTNYTLKKMKQSEKNKYGVTINLKNNPKIKGRNYNRYLDGGYISSSSNNNQKKINPRYNNINSTTSNGKNTKVSSTTIEMDSKNLKTMNSNINKESNTIFISSNSRNINNKNNIKKPNFFTKLFSYNSKDFIKKVFKEINKKNSCNLNFKKSFKRNIKIFSPIEKSSSKTKISNSMKDNKKLSTSSSSPGHKHILSYNSKKNYSVSKIGKIPHNSYQKSLLSYKSKSKSKSKDKCGDIKHSKIKENFIPATDRETRKNIKPELMSILNSKFKKKKRINVNKKTSMSHIFNKKKYNSSSINSQVNNKNKDNKIMNKKCGNRNKNNIITGDSLLFNTKNNFNSPNKNSKLKNGISGCFSLSPKRSPDYNKILKTMNHFHSISTYEDDKNKMKNTKKIKNSVFPKKDIKKFEINGFNNLLPNSNSNSRNSSNSERLIFNEALSNKISRTNRNNKNLYSKTYLEIFKKKF